MWSPTSRICTSGKLFKVLELMGYAWAKDCEHVAFGMVSYEGQTLSTREGRVVYLDDLLHQAIRKARDIIEEKSPTLDDKDGIARQIGVGRGCVLRALQQPHQGHRLLVGSRPQL